MDKVRVFCPRCMTTNAVIRDKLDLGPACGKCGALLLPARPMRLNGTQFLPMLSNTALPVLVNFGAPWCGHSRGMAPDFEAATARLHPQILAATVDTQEEQPLATQQRIRSTPTLALFLEGEEKARISGAMDTEQIVTWVRANLS